MAAALDVVDVCKMAVTVVLLLIACGGFCIFQQKMHIYLISWKLQD